MSDTGAKTILDSIEQPREDSILDRSTMFTGDIARIWSTWCTISLGRTPVGTHQEQELDTRRWSFLAMASILPASA